MKKMLSVFFSLLLLLCLFGCSKIQVAQYTPTVDLTDPFVGFRKESTRTVDLESYTRIALAELEDYQSKYADYGETCYFDTLEPEQQTVYHIIQYAMDHAMPCLFIDKRVLPDIESEMELILHCLALDQPLLEQNLHWSYGVATVEISNPILAAGANGQSVTGIVLEISEFTTEKMEKKEQALLVAGQILKDLPATATPREKAEYLYRYLGANVEYHVAEDRGPERDYLYDALVERKTLCDGFANAYSLLCNMAGVPCVEKEYTNKDGSGHTWNAVFLDGVWYNVDATAAKESNDGNSLLTHFCFPDELLKTAADYEDRAPKCEKYLVPPDVTVSNIAEVGALVKTAWNTVKETDRDYVVVRFPDGEQTKDVMQEISNALRCGISYYCEKTRTGEAIYYILLKE